ESAGRAVAACRNGDYASVGDLARRARIPRHELTRLALAGALSSLCGARRQALWEIQALGPLDADDLFFGMAMDGTAVELPPMGVYERVCADYDTVGLSLEKHPLELLRPTLKRMGAVTAEGLKQVSAGRRVKVGGMMICRQMPPTAKGICFISLEDETGIANLVVPSDVYAQCRKEIHGALFLVGEGMLERSGKVTNVKTRSVVSVRQ
ncbi:error-prone DNA polymerase, partial [Corallococcus sicarius]